MVALLSSSASKSARFRPIARRSLPAPRTLVVNRISDLHRRLIDPASDVETVKNAKHSLLRLLSDPLTLPVITLLPMELPVPADADVEATSAEARRVRQIHGRALSPRRVTESEGASLRSRKKSTRSTGAGSSKSGRQKLMRRHPFSIRAWPGMPLSPARLLS